MYIFFKKLGERIFGADAFCRAHPPAAPGVSMKRLMNAAAPTGPSGSATFSKKMPGKGNNAGAVAAGLKHRISQDSGRQGSSNSASIGTNSSGFLNTSNDAVFDYMAEVMFSVDPGDYKVTDGIENEVAAAVDGDFLGPQQEGLITSAVNFNSMLQLYPTAESYVADKSDVIELFIERLSGDDKYVLDRMKDFGGELEGDTVAEIERIRNRSRQISTKLGIWFRKLGVAAYGEDVFNQVYRDVQMPLQRGRPLKKRMHKEVQLTDADEDNADDNERPIDISKFIGIAEYQAAADDHTVSTLQRHQNGHVEASDAGQTAVVGNIRSIFEDMDGSSYERARSSIDFGLLRKLYPSALSNYLLPVFFLLALLVLVVATAFRFFCDTELSSPTSISTRIGVTRVSCSVVSCAGITSLSKLLKACGPYTAIPRVLNHSTSLLWICRTDSLAVASSRSRDRTCCGVNTDRSKCCSILDSCPMKPRII
jgi:hypothetical protein